jgi:light-independent protochlorophyllide reductase subunit B
VNVVAPLNATPTDIARLPAAHFNVLLSPETGEAAARFLEKNHDQPYTKIVPIGVGATRDFIAEVAKITDVTGRPDESRLRMPWWSRSVDSTYLTGKRVFIFGDGTHVAAHARIARDEMGFEVVGVGCYNREMARPIRALAKEYGVDALITDDYLEVEEAIEKLSPEMILGTQMERHIGKRLGIPCAVISAPVHVQDFPARYSPQVGFEGANVIFDTLIHPLVMGLEEHLLTMFRDDFEFHDAAGPSHHGGHSPLPSQDASGGSLPGKMIEEVAPDNVIWLSDAERELKKIPFFVRGKARRNTEAFAMEKGLNEISLDTLYEAKAHYAR